MSKTTKYDKAAAKETVFNQSISFFFDAWILMLVLGGLSSNLGIPRLSVSYWTALLIMIAANCILPQNFSTNAYLKQIMNKDK